MLVQLMGFVILSTLAPATSQPGSDEPTSARVLSERGDAWYAAGDWEKAIKDYTEAIRLDSKWTAAFIGRGMSRLARREQHQAMSDFDEALRLEPKNPTAFFGRGATWAATTKWDEAIRDYSEAIRLNPNYTHAFIQRSYCYQARREWDKGLRDAEEAIKLNPKDVVAVYARGTAHQGNEDWEKALADFEKAIQLDPKYAYAYSNAAMVSAACPNAKFRNAEKALKAGTKACELSEWKNPDHLEAYAAAAAEAGDYAAAVKWQKKVLDDAAYVKRRGTAPSDRLELYKQQKPYRISQN